MNYRPHTRAVLMRACLLLLPMLFLAENARATEYVRGQKIYFAENVGWKISLAAAADAVIPYVCYPGSRKLNCRNFRDEEFETAQEWRWRRYYTYTSPSGSNFESVIAGSIKWECPNPILGWRSGGQKSSVCSRPDKAETDVKNCGAGNPRVGNPIMPLAAVKVQTEVDYLDAGAGNLSFSRTYRSDRQTWAHSYQAIAIDFTVANSTTNLDYACYSGIGDQINAPYCFPYIGPRTGQANDFAVVRGVDRMLNFGTATDYTPKADINDRVTKLTDAAGQTIGWSVLNAADESTEMYDAIGRLQSTTARNGQKKAFIYSDGSTSSLIAPKPGLLLSVTDHFNRKLAFTYDAQGRMATMTDPSGGVYNYAYDEASSVALAGKSLGNNLTSVTYPDGSKRIYWYNEQDKTLNKNFPKLLTGITDENGVRHSTYKYSVEGLPISTEHAGGVEKYTVSYPYATESIVTDPRGSVIKYNYKTLLGVAKAVRQSQPAGAGCAASSSVLTYDANANVASRTDFNGVRTTYSYDLSRNLETGRVEASGTAQARTITTQWHATFRLPTAIWKPKHVTKFVYDLSGNLLTRTEQATTDSSGVQGASAVLVGTPRTWTYTYNAAGQVLTMTGPRTDVAETTTYEYDEKGNLITVTNAAGHVTSLSNYDAAGHVGRITDPIGVVTDFTYSPRGWLTSRTVSANGVSEVATYDYDNVGQVKKMTLPDGGALTYTYDDAHRLIGISDGIGNRIVYTLDTIGNRIKEEVKDPSGVLTRHTTRVYDALNRLQQITGGVQ